MSTNPNMEAIQTVTVSATSAANITFSNIPQTYTDLVIKLSGRSTDSGSVASIRFNGSTANLSGRWLVGTGSSALSGSDSPNYIRINPSVFTANTFGNSEIYITNYTSSNNKSFSQDGVSENNATEAYANFIAGLWSNSAAITSITLIPSLGNFAQYSTATLYGITNAAVGAKATGGIISETDTHWIHTFTASGTFTPSQNLTADYLVVAGGGGGGSSNGAGGGAGGLRSTVTATGGGGSLESALSLTASTSYTVTVGAGGSGSLFVDANTGPRGTVGSNSVFSTITSTGGGGGGSRNFSDSSQNNGGSGGSGGGAGGDTGSGTVGARTASPVQGNNGGTGGGANGGGGGGGAGAVGNNGNTSVAGAGGNGIAVAISGSSVTYAGGGGGGGSFDAPIAAAAGGSGGGGAGEASGVNNAYATSGTSNTGGGGGGGGIRSGGIRGNGGSGGSGIVIVRYAK